MKTTIDGYSIFPGDHCRSVAMRGLLHHYCGLERPGPAGFGLGPGAPSADPPGPRSKALTPVHPFGQAAHLDATLEAAGRAPVCAARPQAWGPPHRRRAGGSARAAGARPLRPSQTPACSRAGCRRQHRPGCPDAGCP